VRETVPAIDLLFTCHTAHYAFEVLRRAYRVQWERVGAIEDGIGSYFAWQMIPLHRQLLRSAAGLLRARQALSLQRHGIGDPRLGFVSTLAPERVHLHPGSRATVVDLRPPVRRTLALLALEPPEPYAAADALLFLPPVLHHARLTPAELLRYVEGVRAHPAAAPHRRLLVKPHPRERRDDVAAALAPLGAEVSIGGGEPVELFVRELHNPLWLGSPSTAMLNKELLYPDDVTRYALFPLPGNPNVLTQVEVLRGLLGPKLVHVAEPFEAAG
jgi:hypothetical protein